MRTQLTHEICALMSIHLSAEQNRILENTLHQVFSDFSLPAEKNEISSEDYEENTRLINLFIAAKKIEGCSDKTLQYYSNTLIKMVDTLQKSVTCMETNDLRYYLSSYQNTYNSSKVTIDNIRRIMSTFFAWLEDEDYILPSPTSIWSVSAITVLIQETGRFWTFWCLPESELESWCC